MLLTMTVKPSQSPSLLEIPLHLGGLCQDLRISSLGFWQSIRRLELLQAVHKSEYHSHCEYQHSGHDNFHSGSSMQGSTFLVPLIQGNSYVNVYEPPFPVISHTIPRSGFTRLTGQTY
jgi:hypothetical protein